MLRTLFALCAGLFAAMIVYTVVAAAAQLAWVPPTGTDLRDPAQVTAFVASLPMSARLAILAGPVFGSFVGGAMGARLAATSHRSAVAAFIGALVAALTVSDWQRVGHPGWMLVLGVLLPLLATLLSALLVRKAWPAPGK